MRYELAIFDMDGTILDTLEDITAALNYALSECGFPNRSLEEVRHMVGNGLKVLVKRAVPDGTSDADILKVYNVCAPYYHEHAAEKTGAYPGIIELLKTIRDAGCKTAVVSNKPDAAVKELAKEYFPGLFDIAIGEDEKNGRRSKPASDEVDIVLNTLHYHKSQAVYIGDSEVDVDTAKNSEIDIIAVDWGFRDRSFLEEKGVQTIVSRPYEIEKIILTDLSSIKKVSCPKCGGVFDDNRDRCPFCQTMYEPGAERVYMHKLGEIREDLEDLQDRAVDDTVTELKKTGSKLGIIVAVILAVIGLIVGLVYAYENISERILVNRIEKERISEEEWKKNNSEEWNRLYSEGKYEELYKLYEISYDNGEAYWIFERNVFLSVMMYARKFQFYYDEYMSGDVNKNVLSLMVYYSCHIWDTSESGEISQLTSEEYEYLSPEIEKIRKESDEVFGLSDEDYQALGAEGLDAYIVSWDKIDALVKLHMDEWSVLPKDR